MCNDEAANGLSAMTVVQYLGGIVNFPVAEEGVKSILAKRGIDFSYTLEFVDAKTLELATADLYAWIATSPYRVGSTGDSDNGWEHTSAGWSLTEADRKFYLGLANDIYDKYDEPTLGRSKIRIANFGIRHTDFPICGCGRKLHSS